MKIRLVIFLAILAVASYLAFDGSAAGIGLAKIKGYIRSFGYFAPLVYILIFTLVPLTVIPNSLLAISGGALFGIYYGTLYTIIGALSGATIAFALSRYLGKSIAEKFIRHKADWLNGHAEKNGFMIVFLLRLIPLIPHRHTSRRLCLFQHWRQITRHPFCRLLSLIGHPGATCCGIALCKKALHAQRDSKSRHHNLIP